MFVTVFSIVLVASSASPPPATQAYLAPGTPEVGGLTTIEAQGLIRGLRGLNIVGADVVEVSPPFDSSGNTALIAATIMYEILCILAEKAAG